MTHSLKKKSQNSTSTKMPKNNDTKSSSLRFDEQSLASKGYVQSPNGSWHKPSTPTLDRLAAREHTQQKGTLERKTQKTRSGPAGRKKSSRRKRPAEIIITMTAHLPRYLDDDNLAGALKPVRDELADWIQIDDGDRRILWQCEQVLTRGQNGVCVAIEHAIKPTQERTEHE